MCYIFKTKTTMKDYNCKKWFVDMPGGGAKRVGYVITGKSEFDKGDYTGWSAQYIDLWVTILTVVDTVF